MHITITVRHCDIPGELRERAQRLVERLGKVAPRAQEARIIFAAEHGTPTVELRLHRARGLVHVGLADGADHRSALDRAAAKVRRQLDKPVVRRSRAAARAGRSR